MDTMLQFVELILNVGERYTLDVKDLGKLCKKIVVLSMKYVSRKDIWKELFDGEYVDWDLLERDAKNNVLGGCSEWLSLLNCCSWQDLSKLEGGMARTCPPIHQLRENMKACKLDMGGTDTWTLPAKVMVLYLVRGLASSYSIEVLTCQEMTRNTRDACTQFMSKQAETLFSPDDYMQAIVVLMKNCTVNTEALQHSVAVAQARLEKHRLSLKMSRMAVMDGRPSLMERRESMYKTEERKAQLDTALQTWDSYTGFCYKHHLSGDMSEKIKSKLYFMASQTRWAWRDHVHKIVENSGDLHAKVMAYPIAAPDVDVLCRVIEYLKMGGAAPFPSMTKFRRECFRGFPISHVQQMSLSQILKLYTAAYQPESIWKECWKSLVDVISSQIIADVERFVGENPFDADEVMEHLTRG